MEDGNRVEHVAEENEENKVIKEEDGENEEQNWEENEVFKEEDGENEEQNWEENEVFKEEDGENEEENREENEVFKEEDGENEEENREENEVFKEEDGENEEEREVPVNFEVAVVHDVVPRNDVDDDLRARDRRLNLINVGAEDAAPRDRAVIDLGNPAFPIWVGDLPLRIEGYKEILETCPPLQED